MANSKGLPAYRYAGYDVLVAGSGLAAVMFARRAAGLGLRVLLLEGGAEAETRESHDLVQGEDYGHFHNHWAHHWVRAVGGTSRRWNGVLGVLDDRVFRGSELLPAWPIRYEDLQDFYREAARALGRPEAIVTHAKAPLLGGQLLLKPFSTGEALRLVSIDGIRQNGAVDVVVGTHVVSLRSRDRRQVEGIVTSEPGRGQRYLELLPGQHLVLACGGLGNAQILLQPQPDSDQPIGNESGLVGRFLMEHPHANCAEAYLSESFLEATRRIVETTGFGQHVLTLMLDEQESRGQGLIGSTLEIIDPVPVDDAMSGYWSGRFGARALRASLYGRCEQEPQAGNRLMLTGEKNAAGLYRLRAECCYSTLDLMSIYRATRLVGQILHRNRVGVVKIDNDTIFRRAYGGGHTMGTTRMGRSPADSVCDANCRVHGYENLYLAGSSTFTTGGAANPTLTLVALAHRLAVHVAGLKAGRPA